MSYEIHYQPLILRTLGEIMAHFRVGKETVHAWIDAGAPIAVENHGAAPRYSCEAAALQKWRCENGSRNSQFQ